MQITEIIHRNLRKFIKSLTVLLCIVFLLPAYSDNVDIEIELLFASWAAFLGDLLLSCLITKSKLEISQNGFWTFQKDYSMKFCFIVKFFLLYLLSAGGGLSRGNEIVLSVTYIGLIILLTIDFWWYSSINNRNRIRRY